VVAGSVCRALIFDTLITVLAEEPKPLTEDDFHMLREAFRDEYRRNYKLFEQDYCEICHEIVTIAVLYHAIQKGFPDPVAKELQQVEMRFKELIARENPLSIHNENSFSKDSPFGELVFTIKNVVENNYTSVPTYETTPEEASQLVFLVFWLKGIINSTHNSTSPSRSHC
jgi:hypothetical protein